MKRKSIVNIEIFLESMRMFSNSPRPPNEGLWHVTQLFEMQINFQHHFSKVYAHSRHAFSTTWWVCKMWLFKLYWAVWPVYLLNRECCCLSSIWGNTKLAFRVALARYVRNWLVNRKKVIFLYLLLHRGAKHWSSFFLPPSSALHKKLFSV